MKTIFEALGDFEWHYVPGMPEELYRGQPNTLLVQENPSSLGMPPEEEGALIEAIYLPEASGLVEPIYDLPVNNGVVKMIGQEMAAAITFATSKYFWEPGRRSLMPMFMRAWSEEELATGAINLHGYSLRTGEAERLDMLRDGGPSIRPDDGLIVFSNRFS